ncbi:MAG: efflux RND transporter permease subunit [Elusimicrobiota bacterium]
MKIIEFSVKRPVFTTMLSTAIMVLGFFAFARLGVDLYPNVEFPFVTVQTSLRGASPEEIESSVTKIIEEAVNTVSGIEDLSSTSYEGLSVVMIKFQLEKNPDVAAQEVRDKVNSVLSQLPQGTDQPVVSKVDFGSMPVMSVAAASKRNIIDFTRIVKKQIKESIETVNGVGGVDLIGGREREIHISVNPLKLQAMNISIKQVKDALTQHNVEIPGGKVEQKDKDYVLRTLGRISSPKDFNDIVVTMVNGAPVKISDIAKVEDTGEEIQTISYLNGVPAVTLSVKKQSGTNTVEVIENVKKRLEEIKKTLPKDIELKVIGDQSVFIKGSVHAVYEHLVLGSLLASLVILLFIGDWRSTIISSVAIPVSLIGSFALMEASGFTLNNMTLLGLMIAVGLVIDDAVVMIENIHRHMEKYDKSSYEAAVSGSAEIGFAVIAISVSLLAIFVPLAYMSGMIGRFLKSYGLSIAYAVTISTFVALTITPMLSSLFLKKTHGNSKFQDFVDNFNKILADKYSHILQWALANRKKMIVFAGITIFSMFPLLFFIGKDFLPQDDTGMFQINITAPEGTNLEMMKKISFQIEEEAKRIPYVRESLVMVGSGQGNVNSSNQASLFFELTDASKRSVSLMEIMSSVRKMLAKYKDLRTAVIVGGQGSISGMKNYEMEYVITGPELKNLQDYSLAILDKLKTMKGAVDLDTSFTYAKPEYRVIIDREKAARLGVKPEDIATSLRTMVGGAENITKYKEGDDLYQVRVRADKYYRSSPETVKSLMVPAAQNKTVRLDTIARLEEGFGPTQIDRYNRQRKISVYANVEKGASLSKLLSVSDKTFESFKAPAQYKAQPTGRAREFGRMLKSFLTAFIFAFIFVYIVLAAQFESFVYPVSIIVVLPLTLPFAIISLFLTGSNMTIFALMGMFMLFGIVKKNSILQVDYTNTLRSEGKPRYEAMIEANRTRLRPILMTTLTLIFAMLPTAFGSGPGANMRRSMAWVIIGGQSLSLLITLLMTPVTYSLMDDAQEWIKRKLGFGAK